MHKGFAPTAGPHLDHLDSRAQLRILIEQAGEMMDLSCIGEDGAGDEVKTAACLPCLADQGALTKRAWI